VSVHLNSMSENFTLDLTTVLIVLVFIVLLKMKIDEVREEQRNFLRNSKVPHPANFFMKFKYCSKKLDIQDYDKRLNAVTSSVSSSISNQRSFSGKLGDYEDKNRAINRKKNESLISNTDNEKIEGDNEIEEADEIITDFLEKAVECSKSSKTLCLVYIKQYPNGDIIDFCLCSSFSEGFQDQ
ncbi:8885_t:CDS:2, partial [Funneliformis caledonium]